MRKVQQTAYAKINLSLEVRMIMQTIDLCDELTFETQDRECPAMEVVLETDSGELSCGEDNLIVRAVRCMETRYGIRKDLKIRLKKRIPVAAGMAGGSTDAAAALRAVRDLFVPDVSDEELQKIGVTLGADIPYCITGGTQLSEGIGEKLRVLPDAPQCGLVIGRADRSDPPRRFGKYGKMLYKCIGGSDRRHLSADRRDRAVL